MLRATPRNLRRTFNDRTNSIFKKASELHEIDDKIRITIFVQRSGNTLLVFTTEEHRNSWPEEGLENFVRRFTNCRTAAKRNRLARAVRSRNVPPTI